MRANKISSGLLKIINSKRANQESLIENSFTRDYRFSKEYAKGFNKAQLQLLAVGH